MDNSRELQQIKYKVEDVIRDLTRKKDMSITDLEALTKSVCLLEKVKAIDEGEDSERGGSYHSNASRGMSRNNYADSRLMYDGDDEYSYRRGRSPMTGRYVSRDGGSSHRYYDGGSRNGGYSGHSMRDRAIAKLEGMYDDARTDHEKQFLDECIKMIEYYR